MWLKMASNYSSHEMSKPEYLWQYHVLHFHRNKVTYIEFNQSQSDSIGIKLFCCVTMTTKDLMYIVKPIPFFEKKVLQDKIIIMRPLSFKSDLFLMYDPGKDNPYTFLLINLIKYFNS